LFLSGGSAPAQMSRFLARERQPSLHLVTTLDSGGSSASLRQAFNMPAVGDLRNRLLALANRDKPCIRTTVEWMQQRMAPDDDLVALRRVIESLTALPDFESDRDGKLMNAARYAFEHLPQSIQVAGMCIGNLVLTGMYLQHGKVLERAVEALGEALEIVGQVLPITEDNVQLCVTLATGDVLIGQHLMTGKEVERLVSPIQSMIASTAEGEPVHLTMSNRQREMIACANQIVFPPGSFFSSIIANLLCEDLVRALIEQPAVKVYVPNVGVDPEQLGLSIFDTIAWIWGIFDRTSGGADALAERGVVLLDHTHVGAEPGLIDALEARRIRYVVAQISEKDDQGRPFRHNAERLIQALREL
jgi:CofD-related protein of GAK system